MGHEEEHDETERDIITGIRKKSKLLNKSKLSKQELDDYMIP